MPDACAIAAAQCFTSVASFGDLSQGGSVTTEHAGFYCELYGALKHIMLVPLMDTLPAGSSGRTAAEEHELGDDEWLSSAAAAAKAHTDNIGGQVTGNNVTRSCAIMYYHDS